jgi:hypothetical protein
MKDLVDGQHGPPNYLSYNFPMPKPTFYTKPT